MNKLAILIPTIVGREHYLKRLMDCLEAQITDENHHLVEVFILCDNREKTIGEKRNELMQMAIDKGCSHRAFIDDDDLVSNDYLEKVLPAVIGDYDVCSLTGMYFENDRQIKPFVHELKYKVANENSEFYERFPNHLNITKISLIKDIKYEHKNFGEDMLAAEIISNLGLLKTEYKTEGIIYYYYFRSKHNGI